MQNYPNIIRVMSWISCMKNLWKRRMQIILSKTAAFFNFFTVSIYPAHQFRRYTKFRLPVSSISSTNHGQFPGPILFSENIWLVVLTNGKNVFQCIVLSFQAKPTAKHKSSVQPAHIWRIMVHVYMSVACTTNCNMNTLLAFSEIRFVARTLTKHIYRSI